MKKIIISTLLMIPLFINASISFITPDGEYTPNNAINVNMNNTVSNHNEIEKLKKLVAQDANLSLTKSDAKMYEAKEIRIFASDSKIKVIRGLK
jgi:ABC-type molybdate transport system ATPase subunit